MPRKDFIADLERAAKSSTVDSVHGIGPGEDDGQFTFYFCNKYVTEPVSVTAGVTDLSNYPKDHDYFLFAADETPAALARALQDNVPKAKGKSICQLLDLVSGTLLKYANSNGDGGDFVMADSRNDDLQSDDDDEEAEEEDDVDDDDDDPFDFGGGSRGDGLHGFNTHHDRSSVFADAPMKFRDRIRSDLRAAKKAGFKVGCHGDLFGGQATFVALSIRVVKLGISEEAMQAWQVEPSDYLVFLLKYPSGYKTNEQICQYDFRHLDARLQMRVCLSKRYKPTLDQAIAAFATSLRASATSPTGNENAQHCGHFRETFISKPLQNFLNERLPALLRYREVGMDWNGAEQYYNDHRGYGTPQSGVVDAKYFVPEKASNSFPAIVMADHRSKPTSELSFPLLGMQLLLRHFVRCTEFCLVCHRKVDTIVEAIKPFVCSDNLCLYQYMSLGFGPSIEHELLTQENVVDLLISFCYSSASCGRLKDLPIGLALSVPESFTRLHKSDTTLYGAPAVASKPTSPAKHVKTTSRKTKCKVKFDRDRREILFEESLEQESCPVRVGDWISIELTGTSAPTADLHCRVTEITAYPSVRVGPLIDLNHTEDLYQVAARVSGENQASSKADPDKTIPKFTAAAVEKYDINFDELGVSAQRIAVQKLISSLPSVQDMKEYLASQHTPDLKSWGDRISPSARGILRWIVASNRACIMQVDGPATAACGMQGWKQFRFAMGAPDKEQRFLTSVRDTKTRLNLKFPTLFAWHGSPLQNWHSIIREGLHFDDAANGRAYGNGVYHSLHYNTSVAYSSVGDGSGPVPQWTNSKLRVSTVLALNEIVNAPAEFVSKAPHLVVAQLDWIQTRYLFVQCVGGSDPSGVDARPANVQVQDPLMTPSGSSGGLIVIPAKPGKTAKRKMSSIASPRKRKKGAGKVSDPVVVDDDDDGTNFDDDGSSDTTEIGDLEILFDEIEVGQCSKDDAKQIAPKTDFVPGTLDHDSLVRLPTPDYANIAATKRLQADFRALLKVQQSTPSHELGWYIDPEKFDNVYQWIVELHSFHMQNGGDKVLPLVTDMKKHNITSIVLELRFPGSYPMSPPFVRVIRPRFLPFFDGGGGNVTSGGALCMELLTKHHWMERGFQH
ncbi:hypothetical protein MBLNU459_g7260t1 [Dothideomycetes sp. NU459]